MDLGFDQRRGFCPSLQTPMESGDGLLVRLPVRTLSSEHLRELVRLAAACGNGLIEITRRGNLQLRGLREATLPQLRAGLGALRIADAHVSLVVNPLHGLERACAPLAALADEIAHALEGVRGLSDKFGVVLDSGGLLRELAADVRVEVEPSTPQVATLRAATHLLGACAVRDVPNAVRALAQTLACSEFSRMRELVAARGAGALWVGMAPAPPPTAASRLEPAQLIGQHADPSWLGLALPFGSGDGATWRALADIAARFGIGEVRFTPFRGVIVPGVRAHEGHAQELAAEAGWITDPHDPLLRAVACPGAPACASALGETRRLARELLPLLPPMPLSAASARLHVSGCSKGCAHSGPASITLVCDARGARLGFDASAKGAAENPALPLETVRARLFALAKTGEKSQARAS